MEDLQAHVRSVDQGFDWSVYGDVKASYMDVNGDNLVLFNYTPKAQYAGNWNWFERNSRGLILNVDTGEVVARPFEKFFNWLERGRRPPKNAYIQEITEKMDGSLGILYRGGTDYFVASRGSFVSEQAVWATDFLNENYDLTGLPENLTLIFEIIMPQNRIVVDYGDREDLVLIGARDRETGHSLPWFNELSQFIVHTDLHSLAADYGFGKPRFYSFNSIKDILEAAEKLDANSEGYVMRYSDDSLWKIKGDRYVEVHRVIYATGFKRVLHHMKNGTLKDLLATVPEELLGDIRAMERKIKKVVHDIAADVHANFMASPFEGERKEFALWVKENCPELSPYMFAKFDKHDIIPMIFDIAFKNYRWEFN
jgi:RNA ligase